MAVVNRTVDEILILEEQKKRARTFMEYLRIAQLTYRLKKAFMKELAAFYRFSSPPGSTALS